MTRPARPEREATTRVVLEIPMPPNFIRTSVGGVVPVGEISDADLRQVAKRWTDLLLLKARNRRKAKP